MQLERLEIKGFGKLENRVIELSNGLNILYGNNESGKSSTQAFIKAMFFGLKGGRTSKEGELPPVKKYKPWGNADYSGFMEYKLDTGEIFRVGRNFEENFVRVFDSLFNDITGLFNTGKDKSVLFAEKHLGVNESCFERTVFVKQMDTKIQDGNKELANRIINLYQAGADDISFKRAEEALKEALKKHVGTERTSTRPLDRIQARLEELETKRTALAVKRKQMFQLDERLKQARETKESLENRKQILELLLEVKQLQEKRQESVGKKLELQRVLERIEELDTQLQHGGEQSEELAKESEKLSSFDVFEEEDIEQMSRDYSNLASLVQQKQRMRAELEQKEEELQAVQKSYAQTRDFKNLSIDVEKKASELNKEIEGLMFRCDRKSLDALEEKIRLLQNQAHGGGVALASVVLTIAFSVMGVIGWRLGYIIGSLLAVLSAGMLYKVLRHRKELEALIRERKAALADLEGGMKELQRKSYEVGQIYASVGADGYEDFLKRKATCDSKAEAVIALGNQLEQLKSGFHSHERKISIMKNSILERLFTAGMVQDSAAEINEEAMRNFRQGFYRYKRISEEILRTSQRYREVEDMRKAAFALIEGKMPGVYKEKGDIERACEELEKERKSKEEEILKSMEKAENLSRQHGLEELFTEYKNSWDGSLVTPIPDELQKTHEEVSRSIHETLLEVRELETLIKSSEADDDALQKVEEEAAKLREKRRALEKKGEALKLALETLQEASTEIQQDFAPLLNQKLSAAAAKITSGKYGNIKADNELMLKVQAPETGHIIPVSSLSGGTVDQLYLAMRIALADVISSTSERMPLILDEVFSQYDDARTGDTLRYLKELAQERQILCFTCKAREVEICREICGDKVNLITL